MARKKATSAAEVARTLRLDARYAEVFNSGLEVWLYDSKHRDTLKASGAFEIELETAEFEKRVQEFAQQGLIMAYQLAQDDSLSIAVAVGDPRTDGLTDDALARLSVPALGIDCVLIYLAGHAETFEFHATRLEKIKPPREHAGGEWAHCWQQPRMDRLFGMRQNARARVPKKQQETWHPATMQLLKERALEKKRQ